jgi:hypothetical protein
MGSWHTAVSPCHCDNPLYCGLLFLKKEKFLIMFYLKRVVTVRDLCLMVKEKRPKVVFLIETKCRSAKMERVRVRIGFEGLFVVDPIGKSGGLALLWRESNTLEIQNYSRWHINAVMKEFEGGVPRRLTGFYGQPDWTRRKESWALLRHLKDFQPSPWLCCGDFNEINAQHEKLGGAR